jgi:hypothetical protein
VAPPAEVYLELMLFGVVHKGLYGYLLLFVVVFAYTGNGELKICFQFLKVLLFQLPYYGIIV